MTPTPAEQAKRSPCKCGHPFKMHDYSMAEDPFYRTYHDCRHCECKKYRECPPGPLTPPRLKVKFYA